MGGAVKQFYAKRDRSSNFQRTELTARIASPKLALYECSRRSGA